jgi:polygalacturonase
MSNQCAALNVFVLLLAPQAAALSGSCSETAPRLRPTVFDIREFGAVGDGRSCNTKVIQLAINACTSAGGGEVLIAGGSFVTGTI